jgi:tRNA(Ile)-lysidine synthase
VKRQVRETIEEYGLFAAGDQVVVAVSGGADSVALLDLLLNLEEFRLQVVVAHLNHQLRGREADDDEAFVVKLAADYGVPVVTRRIDVRELARRQRLSLEEAGRVARYGFFDEVAATHGARCVALAHHADDQAETVLLRLLRGAGGSGLAAMLPRSADGRYVRPMLRVTRQEIERYLGERNLTYRTDSSNRDTRFLRNRVRHELLPLLAGYNPNIAARLAGTAEALAADEALLSEVVTGAFARYGTMDDGAIHLRVEGVVVEPRGLRLRLYRHALLLLSGDLARIGTTHLQSIDQLVRSSVPAATLHLPGGTRVARSYGELIFFVTDSGRGETKTWEMKVEGPGRYHLPYAAVLVVEQAPLPVDFHDVKPTMAYFDAEQAHFPWLVRNYRPGDRFTPLGMTGRKKLKDLFIDEKIPRDQRLRIPLVFSASRLIWVAGVRQATEASLKPQTTIVIKAEILGFTS